MSVTLVTSMGSDELVARAAWVSTDADSRDHSPSAVERLIRTLMDGDPVHAGPFGHPHLTVRVETPIFVAREWFRHRTWTYSEISGRYVDLSNEMYIPPTEDIRGQVGRRIEYRTEPLDAAIAAVVQAQIQIAYRSAATHYRALLEQGVAREQARVVLPVGVMTRFYGTVSLRNALAFLRLRNHPGALLEIRREAEALEQIVGDLFPVTMRAWQERGRPSLG